MAVRSDSLYAQAAQVWADRLHRRLGSWPHRVWLVQGNPAGVVAEAGSLTEAVPLELADRGPAPFRIRDPSAIHVVQPVDQDAWVGISVPPDRQHPLLESLVAVAAELLQALWRAERQNWEGRALVHELRNPLTLLRGYAELLQYRNDPEVGQLLLEEIDRLNALVEEFLQAGRHLRRDRLDLAALAAEVVRQFETTAAQQGVTVVVDGGPAWVEADAAQLSMVLANLVRNALEAMPDGGALTVTVRTSGGGAEVLVRDTGPGLAPDAAAALFRPYFSTKPGGHGLGLAMSWEVVDRHGGRLEVLPSASGALFRLWLPVR
jgi:signal transduction histidine kinase